MPNVEPVSVRVESVAPVTPALTVAHVPSPRQYVEDVAPVPLFRLVTGRLPVTPFARLI